MDQAIEGAPAEERPVRMCPVCAGTRIRPFMNVSDNGHLRRADIRLPVWQCPECDVFFLNPPPSAEVGREYFAAAYGADRPTSLYYDDAFKERVSKLRLDFIADRRDAGRLLDVGCGKGQFVAAAARRGWDAWGVELDPGACAYAREELGLHTVFNGSVDHHELPDSFEVVTLWDVIEHVPDPVALLSQIRRKLAPGGLLVVRTANIRSLAFDRNRPAWWAFGSDHRFYFSPGSLQVALARAGLRTAGVHDRERAERADRRRAPDISDTTVAAGLVAIVRAPVKILKLARYVRTKYRRMLGAKRYGTSYHISIMTVEATPNDQSAGLM